MPPSRGRSRGLLKNEEPIRNVAWPKKRQGPQKFGAFVFAKLASRNRGKTASAVLL